MSIRKSKAVAAGALSISVLLALTACGGSEAVHVGGGPSSKDGSETVTEGSIYQFDEVRVADSEDQIPFVSTSGAVTVRLSDELKGVIPNGNKAAVEHFIVTAKAFTTGICRLDFEVAYSDGGSEALAARREGSDNKSPHANLMAEMAGMTSGAGFDDENIVDVPPTDEEITDDAEYITRDFSHATFVRECSEEPDDEIVHLMFPYVEPDESGELPVLAGAEIAVIADTQQNPEGAAVFITGWTNAELSVTGKWAPPEK